MNKGKNNTNKGDRKMKRFIFSLLATLILVPTAIFANTDSTLTTNEKSYELETQKDMDIVDTAVSAKMFNTLVAAVKAADLVDVLKSDGPFTVFAPTDAAFAKLPKGTVESLLKPENKDMLVSILRYHVVSGKAMAKDVVGMSSAKTVQGQNVTIMVKDGKVFLNGKTQVIKTDIAATNGVIHVIDSVLMPPKKMSKDSSMSNSSSMNIVETASSTKMFNTLLTAAKTAGMVDTFSNKGPFTVLAPTDEAFAKLPAGTVENLLKPANRAMLIKVLLYHIVPGKVEASTVVTLDKAPTAAGMPVMIKVDNGTVMINNSAKVIKTDIQATNGVIHVIDSVLMPK